MRRIAAPTAETISDNDAQNASDVPRELLSTPQLSAGSVRELLATYGAILRELRTRGILRTNNAPAGDYADYLVSRALGGTLAPNSNKSADVLLEDSAIQVKARVVTDESKRSERQLSAIRSFDFDQLAVVLFDSAYGVRKAVLLPRALVEEQSSFSKRVKAHIFYATNEAFGATRAEDITLRVRAVAAEADNRSA